MMPAKVKIDTSQEAQVAIFELPDQLGLSDVMSLRTDLVNWFGSQPDQPSLLIDASAVVKASCASLQLLLSFRKTVEAGGQTLTFSSPSDAFSEAAKMLGLKQKLIGDQDTQKANLYEFTHKEKA